LNIYYKYIYIYIYIYIYVNIVADFREFLDFQDFDKLSLPFVFVGIFLKSNLYNDFRFSK
jgi:hypothetical protein